MRVVRGGVMAGVKADDDERDWTGRLEAPNAMTLRPHRPHPSVHTQSVIVYDSVMHGMTVMRSMEWCRTHDRGESAAVE